MIPGPERNTGWSTSFVGVHRNGVRLVSRGGFATILVIHSWKRAGPCTLIHTPAPRVGSISHAEHLTSPRESMTSLYIGTVHERVPAIGIIQRIYLYLLFSVKELQSREAG